MDDQENKPAEGQSDESEQNTKKTEEKKSRAKRSTGGNYWDTHPHIVITGGAEELNKPGKGKDNGGSLLAQPKPPANFSEKLHRESEQLAKSTAKVLAEAVKKSEADKAAKIKAQAQVQAKAKAETKAKAVAEAKAKADAIIKAGEIKFSKAGVKPAPSYTAQMVAKANTALKAPDALVLNQTPGSAQLTLGGQGVWTATDEIAGNLTHWFNQALSKLSVPEVSAGALRLSVATLLLHSEPVGQGSDKVPGRDLEAMFALNAQHLAGAGVKIEPGAKSVDLPVRGSLVHSDGQLTLGLLKTGPGVPKTVQVLTAVRDAATGLDKITVPAMAGIPERHVLINPAPNHPTTPPHTGTPVMVPVTPVHTGTTVKPVQPLLVTTTPVATLSGIHDFIYWRPDASGTGVEPVYVMLNDPLDSGRFTRKQLDKKYKHASDFGISDTKKNSETLTKFRDVIEAHLADKETVEKGSYRREKGSRVYFNPNSMNVVVIKANGEWLSGWKINPDAENGRIYLETGEL